MSLGVDWVNSAQYVVLELFSCSCLKERRESYITFIFLKIYIADIQVFLLFYCFIQIVWYLVMLLHWCFKSINSGFARASVPYLKYLDFWRPRLKIVFRYLSRFVVASSLANTMSIFGSKFVPSVHNNWVKNDQFNEILS